MGFSTGEQEGSFSQKKEEKQPLKIALLGTRGIPANYGGFETFAEEISGKLIERGHSVTVYGRRFLGDTGKSVQEYQGRRTIRTFSIRQKYLETPVHAISTNIDLILRRKEFDCALLCNAANSPFAWMINLIGIPLAINVDGIERNRKKWNGLGRLWYLLGEWCSTIFAGQVIADAKVISDYYKERFNCDSVMIPYGATVHRTEPGETLARFDLQPQQYILYVSRLEPENNALGTIEAYRKSGVSHPLVIVGDAPYAVEYKKSLHQAAAGANVIFTGFQFGKSYYELRSHCLLYIQATEVGGTHPALVEALAYGNPTIINGTPENIEVVGDAALVYEKNDFDQLAERISRLSSSEKLREELRNKATEVAFHCFSWDSVTTKYEDVFYKLTTSC